MWILTFRTSPGRRFTPPAVRDTVAFDPLHKVFQRRQHEGGLERDARVAIHLWFFLMKLQPLVDESPERFWRHCPAAIWSPEVNVFQNITIFHWSGNLRTLEKYCRHLIDVDALDRAFDWESRSNSGSRKEMPLEGWAGP